MLCIILILLNNRASLRMARLAGLGVDLCMLFSRASSNELPFICAEKE